MIEVENELKDLLRERAEEFDLPPEIPAPVLRRARRRRWTNGALAAGVAAAVVAGAFVGVRELVVTEPIRRPASPSPTEPVSPTPAPTSPAPVVTSTASPASGDPPATLVAFQPVGEGDPIGRLVLVDTAAGNVTRVILDRVDHSEGGIFGMELAPDERTLYYGRGTSACTNDLERLSLDGGEPEVLASGFAYAPAVSPDGGLLAYLDWDACGGGDQSLAVRDLSDGDEVRWTFPVEGSVADDAPAIRRIEWLSDSRLVYEVGDQETSSLYVLDTGADQGIELGQGPRLGPADSNLELIGMHPEGLAVLRKCLGPTGPECLPEPEIVALDPDTGEIAAILLRPAPDARYELDPTGRHFLYVVDRAVHRWSGGAPVKIAEGYFETTW